MTTPRADWYDDPEDPTHFRYWDGTNWTQHRSPKQPAAPSPRSAASSAWNLFPVTFDAIGSAWRALVLLSLPNVVMGAVLLAAAYATIGQIFDGELDEIIDRVSDGVVSDADARFFEALDPDFPVPMFWVLLLAIGAALLTGAVVSAALSRTGAAAIRGRELEPGLAVRGAGRRLGRIIGGTTLAGVATGIALVPGLAVPPLLLLYVPLTIWLWPFSVAFVTSLALAPAGESPVRQASRLVRHRWGSAARRCLVLTTLWFTVGFATAIATQIFAFDPRALLVGGALLQIAQGGVMTVAMAAWWCEMGGPLDPEIEEVSVRDP